MAPPRTGPIIKPTPAADSAKPRYFSLSLENVLVNTEYVDVYTY